jgi:hypothetical protein
LSRRVSPLSSAFSVPVRSAQAPPLWRRYSCPTPSPADANDARSQGSHGSSRRPSHSPPASSSRRGYMVAAMLSSILLLTQRPPPSVSLTPATRYPPQLVGMCV